MANQVTNIPVNPREHKTALANFPSSFSFHDSIPCLYGSQERYEIGRKLGHGKYSDVFEGYCIDTDSSVVIKILKPVRRKKIYREIKILTNLLAGPNCINLLDVVSVRDSDYPALIMEHGGLSLAHSVQMLNDEQIRIVLFQTLRALEWFHIHGIIHRDTKPGNITYDPTSHRLKLLDYGLAEFYSYGTPLHHRVASRHYKSPEILVNYQLYDYSLDIWSLGTLAAGLIFKRNPFFRGTNNINQLNKIVEVLGSSDFFAMINKYNIKLSSSRTYDLQGYERMQLDAFTNHDNHHLVTDQALDFLNKTLVYDPEKRLTVREALLHPYFDCIRERMTDMAIGEINDAKKIMELEEIEQQMKPAKGEKVEDPAGSGSCNPRPPQMHSILGLSPSALPTWKADLKAQYFPVPMLPSELSKNPGKYAQFDKMWEDFWKTQQMRILESGMKVYGAQINY